METLYTIRGRVLAFRRDSDPILVNRWINDRIRQILDSKLYWSNLLSTGVIHVREGYRQGTVSVNRGSTVVVGSGTSWPVSDLVSTVLSAPIDEVGYVETRVADMSNIQPGMWLYVGGANPEPVPVAEVTPRGFLGKYSKPHQAGDPVSGSSLSGLQFRLNESSPVYDVRAVTSPTLLILDKPWQSESKSGSAYEIVHMYAHMPPDLKTVLYAVDLSQSAVLEVGASYKHIAIFDPQRSSSGWVRALVEAGPDDTGVMRYEMWPAPSHGTEISYLYARYWPEMVRDTDPAPWFLDAQVIADGAIADALNWKRSGDDPYHNPRLAAYYEARFMAGLERLKAQDEARVVKDYEALPRMIGLGPDWYRKHAVNDIREWVI